MKTNGDQCLSNDLVLFIYSSGNMNTWDFIIIFTVKETHQMFHNKNANIKTSGGRYQREHAQFSLYNSASNVNRLDSPESTQRKSYREWRKDWILPSTAAGYVWGSRRDACEGTDVPPREIFYGATIDKRKKNSQPPASYERVIFRVAAIEKTRIPNSWSSLRDVKTWKYLIT